MLAGREKRGASHPVRDQLARGPLNRHGRSRKIETIHNKSLCYDLWAGGPKKPTIFDTQRVAPNVVLILA